MSHQTFFMTNEVIIAKINQLNLSNQRVEHIKKQTKGERILLLIFQNQQKIINAKRKRKWYQIF